MKLKRRRANAKSIAAAKKYVNQGTQWLLCKVCLTDEVEVGADISAVTCAMCVQKLVAPPEMKLPKKTIDGSEKFPRGWHLKKRYVAPDGTVYERGKPAGENSSTGTESIKSKPVAKRGRGRPRKETVVSPTTKRPRGRPRKS